MEQILKRIWPEWAVVRKIGGGTFGTVYEVMHREQKFNLEQRAAVKVISVPEHPRDVELQYAQGMDEDEVQSYFEEIVGDAVREIQLMVNLNGSSNHIVSIQNYSVEKKENEVGWYIFIRMELLTSYNDYVKQHPFSEAEVIKLGCDICDALEVCARKNIIHRDIKPANILVHEESGNFKLGDFGVSRALDGTTGTWSKAGTEEYMAPEVMRMEKYNHRVDIYSLGMVLYYAMNRNKMPFLDVAKPVTYKAKNEARDRRLNGESLPKPCDASPELAEVILKACAFKPEERFASAAEMRQALEQVKNGAAPVKLKEVVPVIVEALPMPVENAQPNPDAQTIPKKSTLPAEQILLKLTPKQSNIMKTDYSDDEKSVFGNTTIQRETIKTIAFRNTMANMPRSAWDVSEAQDGSVMAWVENESDLIIAGENGVKAGRSCKRIFRRYEKVTRIDFNGCFDISDVTNMCGMFSGCSSLRSLDISRWNTSNVTSMSLMFSGCSSLRSLDVSSWNTSNVTSMSQMFYGCSSLRSLDISRWNTSKVTNMCGMFNGCSSLSSLDVSGWNTSKVTDMRWMFYGCSSLSSLDVSGWDTSNVTDMNWMFSGCSSLSSLNVSGWDTSNVTDMSWMFDGCSSLSSLDVSKWDMSNVTNMSGMFSNCKSLRSLDISRWNTSKVTDMSWMFYGCSNLRSIRGKLHIPIGCQTNGMYRGSGLE